MFSATQSLSFVLTRLLSRFGVRFMGSLMHSMMSETDSKCDRWRSVHIVWQWMQIVVGDVTWQYQTNTDIEISWRSLVWTNLELLHFHGRHTMLTHIVDLWSNYNIGVHSYWLTRKDRLLLPLSMFTIANSNVKIEKLFHLDTLILLPGSH